MKHHESTQSELQDYGIDAADYTGTICTVELSNGPTAWYVQRDDGTFWAIAFNEDEIFTTREACHEWLDQRIN